MKRYLIGSDQTQALGDDVKITDITLTPAEDADATLTIFKGLNTTTVDPLVIRASGNATNQVTFEDGIFYPSGLVAIPVNMDSFVIGYESVTP
jgi:hypothetical protein